MKTRWIMFVLALVIISLGCWAASDSADGAGTLSQRVTLLEQQVGDLQARLTAIDGQPGVTTTIAPPTTHTRITAKVVPWYYRP